MVNSLIVCALICFFGFTNCCFGQCQGDGQINDRSIGDFNYSLDIYPPDDATKEKTIDLSFNASSRPNDIYVKFIIPQNISIKNLSTYGIFMNAVQRRTNDLLFINQSLFPDANRGRIKMDINCSEPGEFDIFLSRIDFLSRGARHVLLPDCCHRLICDEANNCVSVSCI